MTRQILLESPAVNRRQPLLGEKGSTGSGKQDRRPVGEMAGGTAAECAAIFCCCPCTVVNLLVLAVYKVPKGLCRKAWKKKKRQRMMMMKKKALSQQQQQPKLGATSSFDESHIDRLGSEVGEVPGDGSTAVVDFETEMWDRFYGAGFWRSPSQRNDE